jgi:hypothetical protein
MRVLGPQIGTRLPVLNEFTAEPGWVDVAGVGPVATDAAAPSASE